MTSEHQFRESTKALKVAVVHDWMFARRGGEKVLEQILKLVPHADVYYLFGKPKRALPGMDHHRFHASFLSRVPRIERIYKLLLPLLPVAVESFDLTGYDLVLSSSSCVAKGAIARPSARHISYIHSPMRYAWDQEHRYFKKALRWFRPIEILRRSLLSLLRIWDVTSSARSDLMIANSQFVARRCQFYYGKHAEVVYPPVEVERFVKLSRAPSPRKKVLLFGAWVPYKKMYDALELMLKNGFLVVAAGDGEDFYRAKKRFAHSANVTFVARPNDEKVAELFSECHTFLFPAVEDFGIVVIEAMAAGMCVVCPAAGGTLETVIDSQTGFHFEEGNVTSMLAAVRKSLELELTDDWLARARRHAAEFSASKFRENYSESLLRVLRERASP